MARLQRESGARCESANEAERQPLDPALDALQGKRAEVATSGEIEQARPPHPQQSPADRATYQQADAPILLRVYGDQGHGAAGLAATAAKDADWLALLAAQTGLTL